MKTSIYFLCFLFIFTATACCDKKPKPQPIPPVEQLPPYTETGANTFGCLIDGEVFVPKKEVGSLSISLQCYYQFSSGKYVFSLRAGDYKSDKGYKLTIGGNKDNDFIKQSSIVDLNAIKSNSCAAGIWRGKSDDFYTTNDSTSGILKINKMDFDNQTISGTFAFDAIDTSTNKIIHVTDGRFDVRFNR